MSDYRSIMSRIAVGAIAALTAGCGGHHLADYDFADRTLAVVYYNAPAPELWTGDLDLEGDSPLEVVVNTGGRVVREVGARRARARLDSAATRVDMAKRMADRTLERSSLYLGTRPVEDRSEADYLMEVDIRRLGLDARGRVAYLFVRGEVVLLDGRTGREIWSTDMDAHDRVTPGIFGSEDIVGDVVTAGALSNVSVDEFERFLQGLSDFVADHVSRKLRADLRSVRD